MPPLIEYVQDSAAHTPVLAGIPTRSRALPIESGASITEVTDGRQSIDQDDASCETDAANLTPAIMRVETLSEDRSMWTSTATAENYCAEPKPADRNDSEAKPTEAKTEEAMPTDAKIVDMSTVGEETAKLEAVELGAAKDIAL
eukprot:gnl/TRDRNA2_/TRDRNA2_223762_c0_seq1.p1 gnl/TRDRNA2_/TRDRNA2_223762_c0~~gnl/TRDRNA2_/TRDRNA2_223762_c0_seq1.p1  ORF type:complete len:156 (-),score=32.38 gnl/TRDRNA2_/TRDRNA2_223762_c0_seq1:41-472(-)